MLSSFIMHAHETLRNIFCQISFPAQHSNYRRSFHHTDFVIQFASSNIQNEQFSIQIFFVNSNFICKISWLFTISCRQTQVKFLHILEVNFRHVSNVNETFFQNDKHDCIWTNIISSWANVQTYNFTRKKTFHYQLEIA